MKVLVVYDSQFGNTQKIAEAIAKGFAGGVQIKRVTDALPDDLNNIGLLIVGSPTQGGRATKAVQAFIDAIPARGLKNVSVAAFDTRFNEINHGFGRRLVMRTIKYAAEKMATALELKGAHLAVPPEAFFVKGKQGPLTDEEEERAYIWGRALARTIQS